MRRRSVALACASLFLWLAFGTIRTPAATLAVHAPPSLQPTVERIEAIDLAALGAELSRAGLALPDRLEVTLIPEDDPRAEVTPRWIVGLASGERAIAIFPQRVLPYPYDSVESVFRHEVAHLALSGQARGEPLPRWFHEGLAISIAEGWGVTDRVRLLAATLSNPATADLAMLFESNNQPEEAQAYGLSAALVADVQRRHGRTAPAAIAARVAEGVPFARAFELETGETPDVAASRAWAAYRRWTQWVPAATSTTTIWAAIMALAFAAFAVRLRARSRRRRAWDEELVDH